MIRTLLYMLGGVVLGGVIHLAVILGMPSLATTAAWDRVTAFGAADGLVILPQPVSGEPNPLRLDPELVYAACQIDLRKGPGTLTGALPQAFWSVAVYGRAGAVIYSTTNRDAASSRLDLGVFNPVQTRLLAEQQLDIAEGMLIVEANEDDILVVVRLAPPYPAMRTRYAEHLGELACGNITG
jgi:uncharacterized membrane protein